jgi:hypothetical protein
LFKNLSVVTVSLDYDPSQGRTRVRLERVLVDYPAAAMETEWNGLPDGMERLTQVPQFDRRREFFSQGKE